MASNTPKPSPKFIGNPTGSKTLAAALANSKSIVNAAKQK
jgi:hypothetical protein